MEWTCFNFCPYILIQKMYIFFAALIVSLPPLICNYLEARPPPTWCWFMFKRTLAATLDPSLICNACTPMFYNAFQYFFYIFQCFANTSSNILNISTKHWLTPQWFGNDLSFLSRPQNYFLPLWSSWYSLQMTISLKWKKILGSGQKRKVISESLGHKENVGMLCCFRSWH